eukprot:SAG22_NODE_9705_length_574_cov_0.972632_1_plen_65_part_01
MGAGGDPNAGTKLVLGAIFGTGFVAATGYVAYLWRVSVDQPLGPVGHPVPSGQEPTTPTARTPAA